MLVLDSENQTDENGEENNKSKQKDEDRNTDSEGVITIEKKCFVRIKTLQKGETFGLQNMLCKSQPGLSLVSNGAEILMISKRFYNHHLGNQTRQNLEMRLLRYPDEDILQRNLKIEMDWRAYKNNVVKSVLKNKRCKTAHF